MTRLPAGRTALYILVFAAAFLLFLVATFPERTLSRMANDALASASNGTLTAGGAAYTFPAAVTIRELRAVLPAGEISLGQAVVKPGLVGWLFGRRNASARVNGPWGRMILNVTERGASRSVDLESLEADLAAALSGVDLPVIMEGGLDADGTLSWQEGDGGSLAGRGRVTAEQVTLSGPLLDMLGLGSLAFTGLSVRCQVRAGVLEITEGLVSGDLSGDLRGKIALRLDRPDRSNLDLRLTVTPLPTVREKIEPFLSLAGGRVGEDGSFTVRVTGPAAIPAVAIE